MTTGRWLHTTRVSVSGVSVLLHEYARELQQ